MNGEAGTVSYLGWRLLAIAFLIGANATFVSLEFALVASQHSRLAKMARDGNRLARLGLRQIEQRSLYIAATQLGITLASLALGWIGDVTLAAILEKPLEQWVGAHYNLVVAHTIGVIVSFSIITFLHIVLGEQTPKIFTISRPEKVLLVLSRPLAWFTWIFRPFIWLLDKTTLLVLFSLGQQQATAHSTAHSVEELKLLLKESWESGVLEQQEKLMLERVFDFRNRSVNEVMLPRTDIIGIEEHATVGEVLHLYGDIPHGLYPVYRDNLDHITGIVDMNDLFRLLIQDASIRERRILELDILHKPLLVPETKPVGPLFAEMRRKRVPVTIAIDEYGGTAGLVTVEDLVEEVMGRLSEEWIEETPPMRTLQPGVYDIQAQLRVDEVNQELGLNIPEGEEYETVAGYLLYRLGHIPVPGEAYHGDGLIFTTTELKGPKIVRIRIEKIKATK